MTIPNPVTEAVAVALANASGGYAMWKGLSEFKRRKWRELANAAILAHLLAIREATAEIHKAGEIAIERGSGANYIWIAMIDQLIASAREAGNG